MRPPVRPLGGLIANLLAWGVFAGLIAAALAVVDRLGFVGLAVLGLLTWLICLRAAMAEATPTWSAETLRAAMQQSVRPEERAALDAERRATLLPLRFYARCGMALTAIGVAGVAWEVWHP